MSKFGVSILGRPSDRGASWSKDVVTSYAWPVWTEMGSALDFETILISRGQNCNEYLVRNKRGGILLVAFRRQTAEDSYEVGLEHTRLQG